MFGHKIDYNKQRDNVNFKGKFSGWWQCFSTSAWMFMSFYTDRIRATNDDDLGIYVDDVEALVGEPGIAEEVMRKIKWITGSSSIWWEVQKAGIEKWLIRSGVEKDIIYDPKMPFDELRARLVKGPVILGTSKMGGLSEGHVILAVGATEDAIECHDPFGDALTYYRNDNGKYVIYQDKYLRKFTGEKIRCIYAEEI